MLGEGNLCFEVLVHTISTGFVTARKELRELALYLALKLGKLEQISGQIYLASEIIIEYYYSIG